MTTIREVKLTNQELLLLDGKVNEVAQKVVNEVKEIMKYADIGDEMLAEIISLALKKGELTRNHREISECRKCGKHKTYKTITRGRKKGKLAYDHPLYVWGRTYLDGFVTIKGYSPFSYCDECTKEVEHTLIDYIKINDLPIQLSDTEGWQKENAKICMYCGEKIWEFDMGLEYTLMADGRYYSECPKCKTKASLFQSHKSTKEFRMVRASELKRVKNCWQRIKT
jgi:hypothetical protein